jgi:hypothetical protein
VPCNRMLCSPESTTSGLHGDMVFGLDVLRRRVSGPSNGLRDNKREV